MNTTFISALSGLTDFLLFASIIAVVLIILVWAIIGLLKIKAPVYKHMIWLYTLLAVVILPVIWMYAPKVSIPVLPPRSNPQLELTQKHIINDSSGFEAYGPLENIPLDQSTSALPAEDSNILFALITKKNILGCLWSIGFLFMLARFLVGWQRMKQIVCSAEPLHLPGNLFAGDVFPARLKIFRSTRIDVPVCSGFFRPVILLPEEMYTNGKSEDLMMILRHELAHIERRDCIINIFQRFIEAILFFHPMIWYASAQLTQQREILCDHHVISKGVAPTDYVDLLTRVIEQNFGRNYINAVAFFEGKRFLSRTTALLDSENKIRLKSSPIVTFASVVIISLFMVSGTIRLEAKTNVDNQKAEIIEKSGPLTNLAAFTDEESTQELKVSSDYLTTEEIISTPDIPVKIQSSTESRVDVKKVEPLKLADSIKQAALPENKPPENEKHEPEQNMNQSDAVEKLHEASPGYNSQERLGLEKVRIDDAVTEFNKTTEVNPVDSADEVLPKKSIDKRLKEYVLDEIRVTADSSMRSLRKEVYMAEEVKFEIFNKLNSNDDFDITCERRIPTGSILRGPWNCDVGYMKRARSEDMHLYFHFNVTPRSDEILSNQFADKQRALKKEMIDLAVKHPELATAMIRANEVRQLYEEEHKKRYKNSIMIGHPEPVDKKEIVSEFDYWQSVFVYHVRGEIPDDIWSRWDSWCRNKLQRNSYKKLWASAKKDKYADEFKSYINTIISGE